jgi:hypothetical protein
MERGDTRDVRKVVAGVYQAGDEVDILALNRMEYGPTDILVTPEDFNWRYSQNPAGQAIISVIRDCNSASVVGFIWIVPLRIRIHGQCLLAAIGTDLVIHPEYRNTFGYTGLLRRFWQVFKDHHIPLHFSFLSERSYRRQREKHPQTVSTLPLLVKPLDFEGLAQTYFTKSWQQFVVGRAGWLTPPFFFRQRQVASGGEITVQAVDQFGQSFDRFWSVVRDKYPVAVERDRAFLAWRFAGVSGRRYHILVARVRDEMLGYAVLRCSTIRGVKTGLIMDLLVSESSLSDQAGACLLAGAETYFRAEGMSLCAGLMATSAAEFRLLSRAGYRLLPRAIAPRVFRFGFFVHDDSEQDLALLSAQDWFITLADYESF